MRLRVLAAVLACVLASHAYADDLIACPADTYVEVTTLTALPEPVRVMLSRSGRGFIEVSDRGGPLNPGDVGGGPFRRFAVAAMGIDHLLVAMENGGNASNVEAWMFELGPQGWTGERATFLRKPPASAKDLIAATCR
jgi:hypothetical protein